MSIYDAYDLAAVCQSCGKEWTGGSLPQLRAFMGSHRRDCKADGS